MRNTAFNPWLRWLAIVGGLLCAGNAWAATYTFGQGWFSTHNPPPCQGGGWTNSGSLYTCSGRVVLSAGDVVIVSTAWFEPLDNVTIRAAGGFTLAASTIGTSSKNISLETDYSTITSSGTNNIYGSVQGGSNSISLTAGTITGSLTSSSGTISLNGTTVNGTLTSSGANTHTNATLNSAVQITSTLTASGTRYGSTLNVSSSATMVGGGVTGNAQIGGILQASGTAFATNLNGGATVSLDGGSVGGSLTAAGAVTTINATTIAGAVTNSFGLISLSGGSVGGKITGPGGVTSNSTSISGDVASTNGEINLTGGTINGNISGGCCRVALNGVALTGNVSATNNDIAITGGTVTGNLTSTNRVTLANAQITGDVTAASWSTITGTGNSRVIGTCTPSVTSPLDLCQAVVVPTCITDNFNRASLGSSDWAVTSRNGSFGVPRIVGNRLRLTDNSGNVATGATFQRLLPASGNYVQVQFKYYAYSGNGADGVAVIFSDASTTPQPGGYGGSLGYAQLNGTSGFAGGWLGIALDEYGNFSNPTETRSGGPGLRQDSVSIRGSGTGTNGYRYLAGTSANLNPGIDISGTSAGPGHTYRITLDSTVSGRTMVTVERNTGSGFTTLISSFNAQAAAGQAGLPSDFFLSLTGSTGGSNNIHELDDFQVCATRINSIGQQIHHFELSHQGNALTCSPLPVSVKACVDSAVPCTTPYTGNNPTLTANLVPAGWSGLNFVNGVATARLAIRTESTVNMRVVSSTPPLTALAQTWCQVGFGAWGTGTACNVTFADSGFNFVFDPSSSTANAPIRMIAAAPKLEGKIQAVKKDARSPVCVPGFSDVTRTISFRASYLSPTTAETQPLGIADRPVEVNGVDVTHTATTNLNLQFDATGSAPLSLRYSDAGKLGLTASYTGNATNGDEGLTMSSATEIRSRPYGLCVQTDSQCTIAGVNSDCPVFPNNVRAGDSFQARIKAVAWQAKSDDPNVGEELTASMLCAGNLVTPKYAQSKVSLRSQVVEPANGQNGDTFPATYDHGLGNQTAATTSISEVGVFRLLADPPAGYLDTEDVSAARSGLVGRFIPATLSAAGSAALIPGCGTTFSYQDQPMRFAQNSLPSLEVKGLNRGGQVTRNYDLGDFWRLPSPAVGSYSSVTAARDAALNSEASWPAELAARDARLTTLGTAVLSTLGSNDGDGARTFTWGEQSLTYARAETPGRADRAFKAKLRHTFSPKSLEDLDGACHGGTCTGFSYDFGDRVEDEVRLGRVISENIMVPVGNSGNMPILLQHWDIGGWSSSTDACTSLQAPTGAPAELEYHSSPGVSAANIDASDWSTNQALLSLTVTAPDIPQGSIWIRHLLRSNGAENATWLCQPRPSTHAAALGGICSYSGGVAETRSSATFGIYKGAAPLIFRREIYRTP